MQRLRVHGSVVVCGTASIPSWAPTPLGPRVERLLLTRRARMQGLLAFDFQHPYEEAVTRLAQLIRTERLRYREDVLEGIGHAPGSIAGLFRRGEPREAPDSTQLSAAMPRAGRAVDVHWHVTAFDRSLTYAEISGRQPRRAAPRDGRHRSDRDEEPPFGVSIRHRAIGAWCAEFAQVVSRAGNHMLLGTGGDVPAGWVRVFMEARAPCFNSTTVVLAARAHLRMSAARKD
jgi:hypothetical protein